jgi:hypothetical protein
MPERQQQPSKYFFNFGPSQPAEVVEIKAVEHGFVNMTSNFLYDSFMVAKEHHLMLIAETAVIEIR